MAVAARGLFVRPIDANGRTHTGASIGAVVSLYVAGTSTRVRGGAQREDDYDVLVGKIAKHQLPQDAFEWFLDLRRYGTVPHGGFGLGLERLVCWVCGIHHIRETIPFPRTIDRLTP